jgi:TorA maturation chaperone TorD
MELFRALAVLAEPPTRETAGVAEALELGRPPTVDEHTELFLFQLYPYASVYLGAEGMMGGEARDRIAGFWRALGEMPPTESDHLPVMLALYARLVELADDESGALVRRANWGNARRAYLWEHLLSWLPVYLTKLLEIAPPFYARWGEVLMEALLAEAHAMSEQEILPLALRDTHALVDPREDGSAGEFWQTVLTPARFGGIITRADLTRAARKVGAGLRMGERKFILKSLFAQDASGVLDWLVEESALWEKRHHARAETFGAIMKAWEERARAASSLLKELQSTALRGQDPSIKHS